MCVSVQTERGKKEREKERERERKWEISRSRSRRRRRSSIQVSLSQVHHTPVRPGNKVSKNPWYEPRGSRSLWNVRTLPFLSFSLLFLTHIQLLFIITIMMIGTETQDTNSYWKFTCLGFRFYVFFFFSLSLCATTYTLDLWFSFHNKKRKSDNIREEIKRKMTERRMDKFRNWTEVEYGREEFAVDRNMKAIETMENAIERISLGSAWRFLLDFIIIIIIWPASACWLLSFYRIPRLGMPAGICCLFGGGENYSFRFFFLFLPNN